VLDGRLRHRGEEAPLRGTAQGPQTCHVKTRQVTTMDQSKQMPLLGPPVRDDPGRRSI
jgi:hypothetical protein